MIVCQIKQKSFTVTVNLQLNTMGQGILEGFKAEICSSYKGFVQNASYFISETIPGG